MIATYMWSCTDNFLRKCDKKLMQSTSLCRYAGRISIYAKLGNWYAHILHSTVFSWLQKGQSKQVGTLVSSFLITLLRDFFLPIVGRFFLRLCMSTKKRNRFSRSSGAISVGQLRCIPESRQRSLHVMPNSSAQENPFFIWENTTFRLTKHCLLLAEGLWSCGSAPCLLTWKALKQTTPSLYSANSVLQQARDNYARDRKSVV